MADIVYADNSATTKPLNVTLDPNCWANPSSAHSLGRVSKAYLEEARARIARALGAECKDTIFFTASGTESSNLVLRSCMWDVIVSSALEHDATRKYLLGAQQQQIILLPNDEHGKVQLPKTLPPPRRAAGHTLRVLVSLIWANNEIGTIQDTKTLTAIRQCVEKWAGVPCFVHLDGVQTPGHMPISLRNGPADFVSLSAHKFHGPRGVGILYSRDRATTLSLQPLMHGGGQEQSVRPGTESVEHIVHAAHVLEFVQDGGLPARCAHMQRLRDIVHEGLLPFCRQGVVLLTGHPRDRLCHHLSFCVRHAQRKALLDLIDQNRICVSGSSACSTVQAMASHVLTAIGVPTEFIHGSVRVSFSILTTEQEMFHVRDTLVRILKEHQKKIAVRPTQ